MDMPKPPIAPSSSMPAPSNSPVNEPSIAASKKKMRDRISSTSGWIGAKLFEWPVVGWGAAAIYGLGVGALYGDEYLTAAITFLIAVAWLCAKCLLYEEISTHKEKRLIRIFIVVAALFAFCTSLWLVRQRRLSVAAQTRSEPGLSGRNDFLDKERAAELESINEFISERSEDELRDAFDFSTIEKDSIMLAKEGLTPSAVTQIDRDAVEREERAGTLNFFNRYIDTRTPGSVRMIPGKWGILILTHKFVENQAILSRYYSSALIPKDVEIPLKDFDKALSDNREVLIDAINEGYSTNPAEIANAYACPKEYCNAVNNAFYSQFINLKPKADAVTAAIRRYDRKVE